MSVSHPNTGNLGTFGVDSQISTILQGKYVKYSATTLNGATIAATAVTGDSNLEIASIDGSDVVLTLTLPVVV